jgi:hypothetical protein
VIVWLYLARHVKIEKIKQDLSFASLNRRTYLDEKQREVGFPPHLYHFHHCIQLTGQQKSRQLFTIY